MTDLMSKQAVKMKKEIACRESIIQCLATLEESEGMSDITGIANYAVCYDKYSAYGIGCYEYSDSPFGYFIQLYTINPDSVLDSLEFLMSNTDYRVYNEPESLLYDMLSLGIGLDQMQPSTMFDTTQYAYWIPDVDTRWSETDQHLKDMFNKSETILFYRTIGNSREDAIEQYLVDKLNRTL